MDKPVVFMRPECDAGAVLDQESDVFPKILAPKAHQRVARGVGPIRSGDGFLHRQWMRSRKGPDLLILFIEAGRAIEELAGNLRRVVERSEAAAFNPGHIRPQCMAVV